MCIILSGAVQPSYQEEEQNPGALTEQYILVSALTDESQPASASIIPASITNVSTYQNSSLGIDLSVSILLESRGTYKY